MLNRQKLVGQLEQINKDLFLQFAKEQDIARTVWEGVKEDEELYLKVHEKKYSLLLPKWVGLLGKTVKIQEQIEEYDVLAVDGSQIYYDKHQGPACYLLNVGSVFLQYNTIKSKVTLASDPTVFVISDENRHMSSVEFVNLQREEYELQVAWNISESCIKQQRGAPFITLCDGSLIFFQVDSKDQEQKQKFIQKYFDLLHNFYKHKVLITGYISFPKTKELVNILKLALAQFDEKELEYASVLDQLTDMDIASYFLEPGYRSIVFESKAPITYLYPKELKPYFCYMHVGYEIVRLEMPAWIVQQESLVDLVCQIAFDQAQKGRGYPVALFEAHEQAVVNGYERKFFYQMMQKISQKYNWNLYKKSAKSMKKEIVPI